MPDRRPGLLEPVGLPDVVGIPVMLRRAVVDDVPSVVALLVDDPLGATRDGADGEGGLDPYLRAFEALDADPAHLLVVAEAEGEVAGTLQLTVLVGLARRGARRAQIDAVRVRADLRSAGLGGSMVSWAVDEARRRGCALVRLTSDKQRPRAHRFWSRAGFVASHEGFTLAL